jgi:predicted ATPase/DNA-binding SARP family transcriptional activator
MTEPSLLSISLLGRFSTMLDGKTIPEERWRLRKVRNLVKCLALASGHQMHREQVIDLLWPDLDFDRAMNMFYQTLHAARKALEPYGQQILIYQQEILSLRSEYPMDIDVDRFRKQAARARETQDAVAYEAALEQYTGDLLPEDLYEEWTQPQRDALREEYLELCEALSDVLVSNGDFSAAIEVLRKAIEVDASREAAHYKLMYAYARSGQRQQSLRQYQVLKEALKRDLDIEPDAATTRLYEDIQAGRIGADESQYTPQSASMYVKRKHNLPAQITSFIGREKEISKVLALLEAHRLVTLTSIGGTGKTRLALKVSENLLEQFSDGVWFVELAGLGDPELVPRAIAAPLGLQESSSRSLLEHLQDHLREKELLLVLDNCEHVLADCARIVAALLSVCPKLKVLASSREAFGILGETAYSLPPLDVPVNRDLPPTEVLIQYSAIRLFVERALIVYPSFKMTENNAPSVVQICRRLDGIPLAIELAAARVSVLSVDQIAARLDNRFRLLTDGNRTALPHLQTLQASIDWSYSLLDEAESLLLLRLSVFYGGWALEMATEVCGFDGLDEFDVIDGMAQLANKSIILMETGADGRNRYRMLETIRQYANHKLLDSQESEKVRNRHLAAYEGLALKAGPSLRSHQQVAWMDHLEKEIDNLRAALEWAVEINVLEGLSLATSIFWFWHIRGHRVEGEQWLGKLLNLVDWGSLSYEDKMLAVEARARQSMLLTVLGLLNSRTTRLAEETFALSQELGEAGKPVQLIALHALQWNLSYQQDNKARELSRQGLALAEELGDRFMLAEFLQHFEHDPDRDWWKAATEQNLAIRRELGDLDGQMTANVILAGLYFVEGDVETAIHLAEEASRLSLIGKNPWGYFVGQSTLAYIFCESGQLSRGIDLLVQMLPTTRDLGEPIWIIWVLNCLGHCGDLKQDWSTCHAYFRQAIDLSHASQLVHAEILSCLNLAEAAVKYGYVDLARQHYHTVVNLGRDQGSSFLIGLAAIAAGRLALLNGDRLTAIRYVIDASKEFIERGNLTEIAHILDQLAVLYTGQEGGVCMAIRLYAAANRIRPKYDDWDKMLFLTSVDADTQLLPIFNTIEKAEFDRLHAEGENLILEQIPEFVSRKVGP